MKFIINLIRLTIFLILPFTILLAGCMWAETPDFKVEEVYKSESHHPWPDPCKGLTEGSYQHLKCIITNQFRPQAKNVNGETIVFYTKRALVDGYEMEPAPTSYINKNDKRQRVAVHKAYTSGRRIDADIWAFNETSSEWERDPYWPEEKAVLLEVINKNGRDNN